MRTKIEANEKGNFIISGFKIYVNPNTNKFQIRNYDNVTDCSSIEELNKELSTLIKFKERSRAELRSKKLKNSKLTFGEVFDRINFYTNAAFANKMVGYMLENAENIDFGKKGYDLVFTAQQMAELRNGSNLTGKY